MQSIDFGVDSFFHGFCQEIDLLWDSVCSENLGDVAALISFRVYQKDELLVVILKGFCNLGSLFVTFGGIG